MLSQAIAFVGKLINFPGMEGFLIETLKNLFHYMTFNALKTYGRDLVKEADKYDPVIGRDKEITKVVENLSRRTKNNSILVGEPGVGKSAVITGLAQRILRGHVPSSLADVRLIALNMTALLSGTGGHFEERLKAVLKEAEEAKGKVILFIDDFHLVFGAARVERSSNVDAANLLKPMLDRGQLRCIAAITTEEFNKYVDKDAAFEGMFKKITVAEPTVEETISILQGLKERYEGHHRVRISDQALVVAAQLSSRYITGQYLPSKAIGLVDEVCASMRVHLEEIDNIDRKIMQLEVDFHALDKEKDKGSKARLVEVKKELNDLRDKLQTLMMQDRYDNETIDEIQLLKQKREKVLIALAEAERGSDSSRAADLRYGAMHEVESAIARLEGCSNDDLMLTKTVLPKHIAEVISHYTGIPVTRLDGHNGKHRVMRDENPKI